MRTLRNGKAIGCLILAAIAATAFLLALQWPLAARVFPMIVSATLFVLALTEFAFSVCEDEETEECAGGLDYQLSEGGDPAVARRLTLGIFLWCLAFFALVLALGFPIATPLFVFLYLKVYSKEKWGISVALTALAGLSFYGLFVRALNVHMNEAWLEKGLRLAGLM